MTTPDTRTAQLADPVQTTDADWIPTGPGKSFRPLRFDDTGWSELMRLEPGALVDLHRHTGEVHAFNIAGTRQILGTGEVISAGDYVYEPAGHVDAWQAVGSEPCIVHIKVVGAVEYLDDSGHVVGQADSSSQCTTYVEWCHRHGDEPSPRIVHLAQHPK